ncbi:hypothetical protein SETIT_5G360900v2 [Setaria italica]|uniref:Probable zinc-ribbon domain-containing protein n=1 Tax=Setaria italica TaxID=4555 RepID=K3XHQ7_SETIT|nr:uncharacterized protein LOC101767347 [Setaria italica]RCV27886.1 hypothetical protein SETIT_5G360900v2 [Setaria italica]
MQAEEVKSRFGRCPYCRAMIYQDLTAIIFYCSKCRTPIRGKNPRPTDETEYALAQLEILSADTASVFSDDVEPSNPRSAWAVDDDDDGRPSLASRSTTGRSSVPTRQDTGAASSSSAYRGFGSVRDGARSGPLSSSMNRDDRTEAARRGSPLHGRVTELRPSSRRTRRSSSGDVDVRSDGGSGTDSESDVPAMPYRRRASPLSSQELEVASVLSGLEPTVNLEKSPLSDPAFQKDLLHALDNLRKLIAAVDHPRSIEGHWQGMMPRLSASCHDGGGGKRTITRRSSRLMRRLESQLTRALPGERPRRDASASSSSSASSVSSSRRGGPRARAHHCRPLLGGTPFVVCDECKEILQLPAALPVGRASRLKCGGCGEAFELTLPASGSTDHPKKIFSAPQPAVGGGEDTEYARAWSNLSGEQPGQVGPLHRVLGYSSVSSVLRSQRYGEHS